MRKCERDTNDGTMREGGGEAEATEAVETIDGDQHQFCAAHAIEARRLNGVLHKIAAGDPEGRRLQKWLGEAGGRAEYDRRVATLPEAGDAWRVRALLPELALPWRPIVRATTGDVMVGPIPAGVAIAAVTAVNALPGLLDRVESGERERDSLRAQLDTVATAYRALLAGQPVPEYTGPVLSERGRASLDRLRPRRDAAEIASALAAARREGAEECAVRCDEVAKGADDALHGMIQKGAARTSWGVDAEPSSALRRSAHAAREVSDGHV